jgi:preprotein translocase subunit SecA
MAGRVVDIILGGNPEMMARHEAVAAGVDLTSEDGLEELKQLTKRHEAECRSGGEQVRELGGLYVLGSERHESRRIDNQLRGRAGRQGDPGESRFYLSLEDDLMRLFATGAMNWVMGRAIPEDVPIEAKMVTKAIERAQSTVEGRNSEIRKEVLKYDEVMNEQRKVIYARRLQVIDGEDLEASTRELVESALDAVVHHACPTDYPEEWDLDLLIKDVAQYYPTKFVAEDLAEGTSADQVSESIVTEALEYYDEHSASLPGGEEQARQIEREVMLQVINQKWREHLAEMDYLREGINLRAVAQMDPLVAWQHDGFEMFGQLMDSIDDDYLRYVLHVQAVEEPAAAPDLAQAVYEAADDPVAGTAALAGQLLAEQGIGVAGTERAGGGALPLLAPDGRGAIFADPAAAADGVVGNGGPAGGAPGGRRRPPPAADPDSLAPVVKAPQEKVGRNDPCWCGSGKKFKFCHGAA